LNILLLWYRLLFWILIVVCVVGLIWLLIDVSFVIVMGVRLLCCWVFDYGCDFLVDVYV